MRSFKLGRGWGTDETPCTVHASHIYAKELFGMESAKIDGILDVLVASINDACPDSIRDELMGELPMMLIGTDGGKEVRAERGRAFIDWALETKRIPEGEWNYANAALMQILTPLIWEKDEFVCREVLKPVVDFIKTVLIPMYPTAVQEREVHVHAEVG